MLEGLKVCLYIVESALTAACSASLQAFQTTYGKYSLETNDSSIT